MSASGALAASTQSAVAPGDNLSNPALAAVSPTSEWVRLSISWSREAHKLDGVSTPVPVEARLIRLKRGFQVEVVRNDPDRVSEFVRGFARSRGDCGKGWLSDPFAFREASTILNSRSAASFFLPCFS